MNTVEQSLFAFPKVVW